MDPYQFYSPYQAPEENIFVTYLPYLVRAALFMILLGVWMMYRKRRKQLLDPQPVIRHETRKPEKKKKPKKSVKKMKENWSMGETSEEKPALELKGTKPAFKKDVKVTEKTREDIANLFDSVKSIALLNEAEAPDPLFQSEWADELRKAEIEDAKAELTVSEVTSEENDEGKFSKMTLDAELIFDEADFRENLDEWAEREFNVEATSPYLRNHGFSDEKTDKVGSKQKGTKPKRDKR